MDELETGAAVADSPAADASLTEDTLPGAQSGAQPPVKEPPFHTHPRFQQLIRENGSLKGELGQLRQEIEGLKKTAAAPAYTPDQREQRAAAIKALRELQAEDPDYIDAAQLRKEIDELRAELSKAPLRGAQQQITTHIAGRMKAAGIDLSREELADLTTLVIKQAARIPGAGDRFDQGDMEVITQALESLTTKLRGPAARAAATTTLDTKNTLRRLPPRTTGGAGGREAPPILKPDADAKGVQAFTKSLAERARAVINGGG